MAKIKSIGKIVCLVISAVLLVGVIIGSVIAENNAMVLTAFFGGTGENFNNAKEELEQSDALCQKIGEESMVLLKNNNDALPLAESERKVNVFGYGALTGDTEQNLGGFLLKGEGSGSSTIHEKKAVSLLEALEQGGFTYNKDIMKVFENYRNSSKGSIRSYNPYKTKDGTQFKLGEPSVTKFNSTLLASAKEFSDVAIFVISRTGGENLGGELPLDYLDITADEQAILNMVKSNFGKVIVLVNTTNILHCGFIKDKGVSAALYVGVTGQSGAKAIPKILTGEITPSGKTADTYAYTRSYDPGTANLNSTGPGKADSGMSNQYMEDIYFGYKWYETADVEGYFDKVFNSYGRGYKGVVQFPFGFGLSYTTFKWEVKNEIKDVNTLTKDTEVTLTVRVTNTGDVAGKDVVELYYTPPYTKGEIEKSAVNLLDFAKTNLLKPGEAQDVTLKFSAYDMASYDCYDKNNNNKATYELDAGDYYVELRTDAHTLATCENAKITYRAAADIIIDKDPTTGTEIENQFTGENAYLDTPIDGSTVGCPTNYLTRSDFAGTFPKETASAPTNTAAIDTAAKTLYSGYDTTTAPTLSQENNLRMATLSDGTFATKEQLTGNNLPEGKTISYNDELLAQLAADYNSETWEKLLNQMSAAEMSTLVIYGGFHRSATESIGKPYQKDYDGPAGFNTNSLSGSDEGGEWTAFPSEILIGCSWNKTLMFELGRSMGAEAAATGLSGWYAPGVNLHRSPYCARNYEYYSEDAVLSGRLAAMVIYGAKTNGLTCFLKHFVCSEPGPNPFKLNTWLTEQNLRENYLKPFEIAVKEGGANAMMSAFNRLGASWCGANHALLTQVLRNEWGFKGVVLTDWSNASEGLGGMNVRQGIRAGNDLWLNPTGSGSNPGTAPTELACLRKSVHNILYEIADTRTTMKNYVPGEDDIYQNSGTISFTETPFAWWRILLYGIDGLVAAFFVTSIVLLVLDKKKTNTKKSNRKRTSK